MREDIFEVEEILLEGGAAITSGSGDPSALDYPVGTIYLRTNGEIWQKGSSVWVQIPVTGAVVQFRVPEGSTLIIPDGSQYLVTNPTFTADGDVFIDGDGELILNE